jgi:type I restriction enzyme S subunit
MKNGNGWHPMPLREILIRSGELIEIHPEEQYKEVTVRMRGGGVCQRRMVDGVEIAAQKRFAVQSQQFIVSRIDARHGAMGIIPDELNGAVVTNDFPVFTIDQTKVLPDFLGWLSKTEDFIELCRVASEGTTNRVRLQEDLFLALKIPLPPLDEQRRVVARIEELAGQLAEARELRRQAAAEAEEFWQTSLSKVFTTKQDNSVSLESVCSAIIDNLHSTPVYDGDEFPCIRSHDVGWGTLNYTTALRTSRDEFEHRIMRGEPQAGDIVYVREGDVGRCAVVDGTQRFCLGQRVMMLRPDPKQIISRFLMLHLLSPNVLYDQVLEGKTGTTSHHVNIGHLRQVQIFVPPLSEQRRIVDYLDTIQAQVDTLKQEQAASTAELDALLPAVLDRAFKGEL